MDNKFWALGIFCAIASGACIQFQILQLGVSLDIIAIGIFIDAARIGIQKEIRELTEAIKKNQKS